MNVRSATAQDAAGIVALRKAANPYGDWYRNPLQRLGRVPYEDLTPLERYLHGGFGMDLSLLRRHLYEYERRGFPVLVAEKGSRTVGAAEVWLDEEPEPFGRYAAVAIATGSPPKADVEAELVERAAERARKLGFASLDRSSPPPEGTIAKDLGFSSIWETRTWVADLADVPRPEVDFATRFLTGDAGEVRGLLCLNHRQPAGWRYEIVSGTWPAARLAGLGDATKLLAVGVQPEQGAAFVVTAARPLWRDPPVTEVDVWIDPARLAIPAEVAQDFAIAAEVARKLGTPTIETFAPSTLSRTLEGLGFLAAGDPAPWLRRPL